jgi:hypothetical protein
MSTSNHGRANERRRRKEGRRPRAGLCTAALRHRKCRNRALAPSDRCRLHPRRYGVIVLRFEKPACLSRRGNVRKCQESRAEEMLANVSISKVRPTLTFPNIFGVRSYEHG